jgi:predicted O-linked N-acetylglucosamine transferase (SPINDLY family)
LHPSRRLNMPDARTTQRVSLAATLQEALARHQGGDLANAERLYREILRAEPRHGDSLHGLGIIALQVGQPQAAIELLRAALQAEPAQPVALLNLGVALRELQRPAEALASFDQALRMAPDYADALNNRADVLIELQRPGEALVSLEQALRLQPDFPVALNNHGNALRALGRPAEALHSYERALRLQPGVARYHNNRGNSLRDLKRIEEALASFEEALRLDPLYVLALGNKGKALLELKRCDAALDCFAQLLLRNPRDAEALTYRGIALLELRRPAEALASLEQAVECGLGLPMAHISRGNALRDLKQPEAALASYERALQLAPGDADALGNRGNALADLRRFGEALESHGRALQLRPDDASLYHNRGNTWLAQDRSAEALIDFERALQFDPNHCDALFGAAMALMHLRRLEDAVTQLDRLLVIQPDYPYARGIQLHVLQMCCDWPTAAMAMPAVLAAVERNVRAELPFAFLSVSGSPAAQLACAASFIANNYPAADGVRWSGPTYRHERIRVAYVSADLRDHVVSRLMAGVFAGHDRQRFEISAISLQPPEDSEFGRRVRQSFDHFIDASGHSNAQVAALMREREIDIAIDLMGITDGHRTPIFAARAAPIQVNYLGFPGTMGAGYIDYLIADRFVVPPESRHFYAEQVVYLPECFQANDDQRLGNVPPPTRTQLGLPESGLVLCCLNTSVKLSTEFFDVWLRVLDRVPGSVLWLVAGISPMEENLRKEASRRGVDPARLVFAPRVSYDEHLARLQCADLFLDTLPFNAGATASDALWAGVPVLTCVGQVLAARMAGSLLHTVGLPELVTFDLADYERRAIELALAPAELVSLRARLLREGRASPLFDTRRFCRHLEEAYMHMWQRYQRGELPASFAVGAP